MVYRQGIFFLPINKQPCFLKKKIIKNINSKFPISEYLFKCGLSLPSSYELNKKEIFYIIKKIEKFYLNSK